MLELIIYFCLAYVIFNLIMLWKFAVKTGREGWELYIPVYSNYVLLKIAGLDIYWFIMTLLPAVVVWLFKEYVILVILSYLFAMFVSFFYCMSLSRKFNKSIGFALGLFFLNPIFMAILTFSKKCVYNK